MKLNRILSFIVIVALMVSFTSIPAFAAVSTGQEIGVSLDKTEAKVGDFITATVYLKNLNTLAQAQFALYFDPTVLQLWNKDTTVDSAATTPTNGFNQVIKDIKQSDGTTSVFSSTAGGNTVNNTTGILDYNFSSDLTDPDTGSYLAYTVPTSLNTIPVITLRFKVISNGNIGIKIPKQASDTVYSTKNPLGYKVSATFPVDNITGLTETYPSFTVLVPKTLASVTTTTTITDKTISNTAYTASTLGLPGSVSVAYTDSSTGTLNVTWDTSTLNSTLVTPQTVYGDLDLGTDNMIRQPEAPATAVRATATVTLQPASYDATASAAALASLNKSIMAIVGNWSTTMNSLPTTVELSFENGIKATYDITWDKADQGFTSSTAPSTTYTVTSTAFSTTATNVTGVPFTSVSSTITVVNGYKYIITGFAFEDSTKANYIIKAGKSESFTTNVIVSLNPVAGQGDNIPPRTETKAVTFAIDATSKVAGNTFTVTSTSLNSSYIDNDYVQITAGLALPTLNVSVIGLIPQYNVASGTLTVENGFITAPIKIKKNTEFDTSYSDSNKKYAVVKLVNSANKVVAMQIQDVSSFVDTQETVLSTVGFAVDTTYKIKIELYENPFFGNNAGTIVSNIGTWAVSSNL